MNSSPRIYETSDGLKFWMEPKSESRELKAPTIRTSDPDIYVVFVPNPSLLEKVYLFFFRGKKFAFAKPSLQTKLHDNTIGELKERNPHLDIVFTDVGRPEVNWFDPMAKVVGKTFVEEKFRLSADTEFGGPKEFNETTNLFFELMAWTSRDTTTMYLGHTQNSSVPFKPVIAGLDREFLKKTGLGTSANG